MVYDSLTCTYFLHIIAWNDVQKISEVKFLEIYLEVSEISMCMWTRQT